MFLTIIIFLIILGVLVFVHELGHFVMARRNGVKVDEFGFGFPPRALGIFKKNGRWKWIFRNKGEEEVGDKTIYSINFIPLGGFVKIKGEDGGFQDDEDSFVNKKPWVRIKILIAGVLMNFILAWILIWAVMVIGIPEGVDNSSGEFPNSKIQISEVLAGTPAEEAGLQVGDEILKTQNYAGTEIELENVDELQEWIKSHTGEEIEITVKRGGDILEYDVLARAEHPEEQGAIGITMIETDKIQYSFFEAAWQSFLSVFSLIWMMLSGLFLIIKQLIFGSPVSVDVSGPVGIAVMTKQVTALGLVYILQFAAILSINLGIINALPIPALDGGRILFVLIEKIKGKPVTQKTEQLFHTIGFLVLIGLMILVTFRDVWKLLV